jgi:hypothetical protein
MPTQFDADALIARYVKDMPEVDDLALIVLKGHLLVEELLEEVIESIASHRDSIGEAKLSFHQKAVLARALCWTKADSPHWDLISKLNILRNNLAHNLESSRLGQRVRDFLASFRHAQPRDWNGRDNSSMSEQDRIRYAIAMLMAFLVWYKVGAQNYRKVVDTLLAAEDTHKSTPVAGRAKGMLIINSEDDEHLKDFAEYMP